MPSRRPHVLWVVPRLPYPARSGGEGRVLSLLRRLKPRYRLTLAAAVPAADRAEAGVSVRALEADAVDSVRLATRAAPPAPPSALRLRPEKAVDADCPELRQAVARVLEEDPVDLLQLEFHELAGLASAARGRAPVVLTEHDAGVLSWSRSYERLEGGPAARLAELARHWLFSAASLRGCDRVVVLSERDRAAFGGLARRGATRVIPQGVALEDFPFAGLEGRAPASLLFVGHFPHLPNEDACARFCRRIWPLIRGRKPEARLALVGSRPTPRVRALESRHARVLGDVPAVQPHLASARLFVAPVVRGLGVKGKLLEAFASGVPVVSSPEACEGLPDARPGEHLLVARGDEEFAAACLRLLDDDALAERLARAARALVEERYTWDHQAAKLDGVYRELLEAR